MLEYVISMAGIAKRSAMMSLLKIFPAKMFSRTEYATRSVTVWSVYKMVLTVDRIYHFVLIGMYVCMYVHIYLLT